MELSPDLTTFGFTLSAAALTLTSLAAWDRRTTAIGQTYLGFVSCAAIWAIAHLVLPQLDLSPAASLRVYGILYLSLAVLSLRLATLAAEGGRTISLRSEAFLWVPPIVILLLDAPKAAAFWSSLAFGLASIRWSQVPLRSWEGFRLARSGAAAAVLLPAVTPLAWVVGLPSPFLSLAAPLAILVCVLVLWYSLPRLGLSSMDRVQYHSVIEAMTDGLLVVDMQVYFCG